MTHLGQPKSELVPINASSFPDSLPHTKDFWMAAIGHELHTPIDSLLGLLGLTLTTELKPIQRHWMELALSTVQEMQESLQGLMQSAYVKSGQAALTAETFELRSLIVSLCQQFRSQAKVKGLHILLHIDQKVPNYFNGSAVLLRRVLSNLISNAIKFTDKGHIKLKIHLVEQEPPCLHESTAPIKVRFIVEDTGCGFRSHEGANAAFSPFERCQDPLQHYGALALQPGTGLGLYLVKTFIDVLSGSIQIQSVSKQGTTITVDVPLTLDKSQADMESLQGTSMVFLTPSDCHCPNDHAEALHAIGVQPKLVTYPRIPPSGESLLKNFAHDDFIYLCTQHLNDQEIIDWLNDASLKASNKPLMLVSNDSQGFIEYFERFKAQYPAPCLLITTSQDFKPAFKAILEWRLQWAKPTTSRPSHIPALNILLLENNLIHQMLTEYELLQHGHCVDTISSIKDLPAKLMNKHWDIILTDLYLDDTQGVDIARLIRQEEAHQGHLQPKQFVCALSACDSQLERQWCLQAGMNAFLTKPLRLDALYECYSEFCQYHHKPLSIGEPSPSTSGRHEGLVMAKPTLAISEQTSPVLLENLYKNLRGNQGLMVKVLQAFLEDTPGHLQACLQGILNNDRPLVFKEAHQLKGSCTYIVAPRLRHLTGLLEASAQTHSKEALLEIYDQAHQEFLTIGKYLLTWFNDPTWHNDLPSSSITSKLA